MIQKEGYPLSEEMDQFLDQKDEEPQEESGDAKTCSVCGTVSDSNFCPHCGAPMGQ